MGSLNMYDFPPEPWQSNVAATVAIHLFWLLIGGLIMVWLSHPKRKPTIWDAAGMLFVGLILTSLLLLRNTDYRGNPSAYPALIYFAWGMTGLSMIWNWYRLSKVGERWDVWFSLTAIFSLLFMGCCLYPSMAGGREASHRSQCKNNLKQIGLAFHNYHDIHERLPAQRSGEPAHSWRVDLLNYLNGSYGHDENNYRALHDQYDFETEWNLGSNKKIANTEISVYQCPSNPFRKNKDGFPITAYVGVVGSGTILQPGESLPISEVTDGTSNTFLAVEACGLQIPWCKPQDVQLEEVELKINGPGKETGRSEGAMSSFHQGGFQAVRSDGSVRFVSENVDEDVLKALTTANGGEAIDVDDF